MQCEVSKVETAPADFVYWIPRDSSSIVFRTRGDTVAAIERQGERHGQQSSYALPSLPMPRFGGNDRTVQRDPPPMTSPGSARSIAQACKGRTAQDARS